MKAIAASRRATLGTKKNETLRKMGLLPGVLYGGPANLRVPITVTKADVASVAHFRGNALLNSLVSLRLDGETYTVIPRHMQRNPLHPDDPISVNFLIYDASHGAKVHLPVNIEDEDKCAALKRGGIINVLSWHVEARVTGPALPDGVPVSVAGLKVGDKLMWRDLKLSDAFKACVTPIRGTGVLILNILGSKSKGGKDDDKAGGDAAAASPTSSAG